MDSVAWKNLIRASKAVMRLCDNGDTRKRRVFTESQELDLPSPTMDRLLPQPVMESIPSHLHPKVKSNVRQTVSATKKIFLNAFQQSAQQLLSLEEQGLSDKAQMDQLRLLWTKLWDKQLFTMQSELEERICNQNEQDESSARKAGSFDDVGQPLLPLLTGAVGSQDLGSRFCPIERLKSTRVRNGGERGWYYTSTGMCCSQK